MGYLNLFNSLLIDRIAPDLEAEDEISLLVQSMTYNFDMKERGGIEMWTEP